MLWYTGLVPECKRKPNTSCEICGKKIYRRPGVLKQSNGKAYCSQNCYGKSCRREIPCNVCGTLILSGSNKNTCSRACANKNRTGITYKNSQRPSKDKVKTNRRLKIRLMEQRGKTCERCGFKIFQILQVHHRDRNTDNNELHNLELLCPNCHTAEHYLKK